MLELDVENFDFSPLQTWRPDEMSFRYNDPFWKIPTHKVLTMPDESQILSLNEFVIYRNPLPRDYGKTNAQYQRTAEPLKLALVDERDYEWKIAVLNYLMSDLFIRDPFLLNERIRRPRTTATTYRLHYARFLLPFSEWQGKPHYDKYYSKCFTAYYITYSNERRFVSEIDLDVAYYAEPTSWNTKGERATTIPADWLSNRIDEKATKYELFA